MINNSVQDSKYSMLKTFTMKNKDCINVIDMQIFNFHMITNQICNQFSFQYGSSVKFIYAYAYNDICHK